MTEKWLSRQGVPIMGLYHAANQQQQKNGCLNMLFGVKNVENPNFSLHF